MKASTVRQIVQEMNTNSQIKKAAIRPEKVQQMLQSGQHFHIEFAPKTHQANSLPRAKAVIEELKLTYPEISAKSTTQEDFLASLMTELKKTRKNMSHKDFAKAVIEKISQAPKVKAEIAELSDKLYI